MANSIPNIVLTAHTHAHCEQGRLEERAVPKLLFTGVEVTLPFVID